MWNRGHRTPLCYGHTVKKGHVNTHYWRTGKKAQKQLQSLIPFKSDVKAVLLTYRLALWSLPDATSKQKEYMLPWNANKTHSLVPQAQPAKTWAALGTTMNNLFIFRGGVTGILQLFSVLIVPCTCMHLVRVHEIQLEHQWCNHLNWGTVWLGLGPMTPTFQPGTKPT